MGPLGLLAAHNTRKPRMLTDAHKGTRTLTTYALSSRAL